jgi:hypothetical protein
MPADEFLGLTMRQAAALNEAWREEQRRLDSRFGWITAWYASVHRDPGKRREPFTRADFFPMLADDEAEPAPDINTLTDAEEIRRVFLRKLEARGEIVQSKADQAAILSLHDGYREIKP